MELRLTILTSTILLFIWLFTASISMRKDEFIRKNEFNGKVCAGSDVVLRVTMNGVTSCIAFCMGKRCAMIFYNPNNKKCTGCYTFYTSSGSLVPDAGSIAYGITTGCDTENGRYNNSCYVATKTKLRWSDAKNVCEAGENRFLAIPESLEESEYIGAWMYSKVYFSNAWLGASKNGGNWMTVQGNVLGYRNWAFLEPNILSFSGCLGLNKDGDFYELSCSSNFVSVCEINMLA